jgi:hypothetical protein
MRLFCVALLLGATAATGASASSFVAIGAPASKGSFVYLGAPASIPEPVAADAPSVDPPLPPLKYPMQAPPALATAPAPMQVSPSIVAMGEPAVEDFQVAAIAEKKPAAHRPDFAPMVIRGGISGEMFARESSPSAMPAPSSPHEEPQQASAEPPKSSKPEPQRMPEPPPPEPARAPPPPPPSNIGPLRGVE